MENRNAVWTINVVVNTRALAEYVKSSGKGSWERPVGGRKSWGNDVYMVATSNQPGAGVVVGNDGNFKLTVGAHDTIRWVVNEINPVVENYRSVCMYGFNKGENWTGNLTDPHAEHEQLGFIRLLKGFDQSTEPARPFVKGSIAEISVPSTKVLHNAKHGASITYHMKLLLLNYKNVETPDVDAYVQIDPTIVIDKKQ